MKLTLSALSSILTFAFAIAAPVPKNPLPAITAENAHKVEFQSDVSKRNSRMIRGPKDGQWILLDYAKTLELVDDKDFKIIESVAPEGSRPIDFALSPDGLYTLLHNNNE